MTFSLENECGVLACMLRGAAVGAQVEAAGELIAADFSDPLHKRLFACFSAVLACGEPLTLPGIADRMRLDGEEAARLAALTDKLLVNRPEVELPVYVRQLKQESRLHAVRLACEKVVKANGEASEIAVAELLQAGRQYCDSLLPETPGTFDSWEEFDMTQPVSFSIRGFLQDDVATGIAGLSGDGKTWTALSITRALLFGPGKLWNLFDVPERAEKVIYLIPECGRSAVKHRLQLMGLYDEIRTGRLKMRTLSKGPTVPLSDAAFLREVAGAHVITDTAIRFMGAIDESKANEVAEGLSNDFLNLLRAGARTVIPLFHSPKSFRNETSMTLENMIRGSSEFGAVLATAWGIKQVDKAANIIHVENLKPRDFDPCGPFEIIGRPFIDETEDFALHKRPDECGRLADEQPDLRKGGGAPQAQRDSKAANLALARNWLHAEPGLNNNAIVHKFKIEGIRVDRSTVSKYRKELGL